MGEGNMGKSRVMIAQFNVRKMSSLLVKNQELKLYVRVLHINFFAAPSTNQHK
jgi:NADPH-dependent 7-cyano-7-deazaguanine reductase QueF-like protein